MKLEILKRDDQPDGQFNHGAIMEKRPVVMADLRSGFRPYSNLFYWAHAWSEGGSTIGEHPHQGFEIMSFILKGEIEHYDSAHEGWKPLREGDMQIIRSGSGISHSEKFHPGGEIFQIWMDPGISDSVKRTATYDDHTFDEFSTESGNGITVTTYAGKGSPLKLDTPGVSIRKVSMEPGDHELTTDSASVNSVFVLEGSVKLSGNEMSKGDFARISDITSISLSCDENSSVFLITNPLVPGYRTYADMVMQAN